VKIDAFVVGAFQENTYLLIEEAAKACVLIDPGAEPDRLTRAVAASGASLEAIWLTHSHLDHIGAIVGIKATWNVPVYLHPAARTIYDAGARHAAVYGLPFDQPPPPDRALAGGDVLTLGALRFEVIEAAGHAPGHVVFYGHGVAFVGDCLFAGSVGRVDLPGSNAVELTRTLERLVQLAPETRVLSGHGPETTIGVEQRTNPFLNGTARLVRSTS
jgi:hydroxyacylglutathione hydrolase